MAVRKLRNPSVSHSLPANESAKSVTSPCCTTASSKRVTQPAGEEGGIIVWGEEGQLKLKGTDYT